MTNRRDFLRLSALSTVAALRPALVFSDLRPLLRRGSPRKVVVIGAGLAGLSAAYELVRGGHDVVVLEAQTRPGGRVETWRSQFSDGLFVETGAGRIPDNHDLTVGYCREFGLVLDPFYPAEGHYDHVFRGRRLRQIPGQAMDLTNIEIDIGTRPESGGLLTLVAQQLGPVIQEVGNPTSPAWPPANLWKYDRMSSAELLASRGLTDDAVALLLLGIADKTQLESISALWLLRELALERGEKIKYKIRGGNDLLPRAFANRLSDNIRYGAPVTVINRRPADQVEVTYSRFGREHTERAEYVVCTVPFPVLRRITVHPRFMPKKEEAISELEYESVTRAFVQFSERYWESNGSNGFGLTDHPTEIWHQTWDQPGRRGILSSYMRDRFADRFAGLSTEAQARDVLAQVDAILPGAGDFVESVETKTWGDDPWAGGAYTLNNPGQMESFHAASRSAEGRIHFAGEHVSDFPGWMQGALQTGRRVAETINSL